MYIHIFICMYIYIYINPDYMFCTFMGRPWRWPRLAHRIHQAADVQRQVLRAAQAEGLRGEAEDRAVR